MRQAWLTLDTIPNRKVVAISLPDDEAWRAQFLGALLLLTGAENWELFGTLTPMEMAAEWLDIFVTFTEGQTSMIPVGTVLEFGGDVLPEGFLWDGPDPVSRTTYSNLFAVYGTRFGVGDGSTTFNLPNRRGRVAVGRNPADPDFDTVGDIYGEKNVTLTTPQIPSHTHSQSMHSHAQSPHNHLQNPHDHIVDGGLNGVLGSTIRGLIVAGSGSNNTNTRQVTPTNIQATAVNDSTLPPALSNTGGGGSHNNVQPSLVMNYIIKY